MKKWLRDNPWIWIVLILIAAGIALAAALGVLHWLLGAFVAGVVGLIVAYLIAAYAVARA